MTAKRNARQEGVSLIELLITIAILGILTTIALPGYRVWIQNTQIRSAAESVLEGMQLARAEAVRRNVTVRFQFVSNFTGGCALSSSSASWIVSLDDPVNKCDIAPSETVTPRIFQSRAVTDGSHNVVVSATGGGNPATTVSFNGLGRVVSVGTPIEQVNVDVPTSVLTASESRDLRIVVTPGGQIRMCDPSVSDAADVRFC